MLKCEVGGVGKCPRGSALVGTIGGAGSMGEGVV